MRFRSLFAALTALVLVPAAFAQNKDQPTLVVRLASADTLAAKGKYLARLIDQTELYEQAEGFFKAFARQGIPGLDSKKAFGLYVHLTPLAFDSAVVALAPVNDGKAFVAFLKDQGVEVQEKPGGLFEVVVPNAPLPGFFRFANGYLYFTMGEAKNIDAEKLLRPEAVLGNGGDIGVATVVFDFARMPQALKRQALEGIEQQYEEQKENLPPAASDAERKGQLAGLELSIASMKAVVTEGGPATLRVDIDETRQDLRLSLSLAAQPNTAMARVFAEAGKSPSVAAGALPGNSILSVVLNTGLPAKLRDLMLAETEKGFKQDLARAPDEATRQALQAVFDGLMPTLKAGDIDVGLALVPFPGGRNTLVVAGRVSKGTALEKALRAVAATMPEAEQEALNLTLDFDKSAGVSLHRAALPALDETARRLIGAPTVHFGVREDAIVAALGDGSLAVLRRAVGTAPQPAPIARATVSVSKLLNLLPPLEAKRFEPDFKKVYGAGSVPDTILMTLQGGPELKFEANVPASVLRLVTEIGKRLRSEL